MHVEKIFGSEVDATTVVPDDFMAPLLQKGDCIGIQQGGELKPGCVVVAFDHRSNELIVKTYEGMLDESVVHLSSMNQAYGPVMAAKTDVEIIGVVVGMVRRRIPIMR